MIKDRRFWQQFEKKQTSKENLTLEQKFKILNAMLSEAYSIGIFPLKNPLEGIEKDIKLAEAINAISRDPKEISNGT